MTSKTDQAAKPKARKRKLTKKREGFVKDYVETGNGAEAARRNFNVKNDNSARAVASELLTFPNVAAAVEERKLSLKEALEKKGINAEKIAETVGELLEATDPDGNPDYRARDKGVAHATRIRGDVSDAPPVGPTNATYNFLFSKDVRSEVQQIEERIKAKLINPNADPHAVPEQS